MPSLTPEYDYHSCRRDADTSVDRSLYLKKKRHERPSARAATPERGLGHAAHPGHTHTNVKEHTGTRDQLCL